MISHKKKKKKKKKKCGSFVFDYFRILRGKPSVVQATIFSHFAAAAGGSVDRARESSLIIILAPISLITRSRGEKITEIKFEFTSLQSTQEKTICPRYFWQKNKSEKVFERTMSPKGNLNSF